MLCIMTFPSACKSLQRRASLPEFPGATPSALTEMLEQENQEIVSLFQIIGAMAEFERALIQERVRAGLRNARAKGRRLGRPRVIVDASRIAYLREQGRSWSQITAEMRIGKGTAQRALAGLPKIV